LVGRRKKKGDEKTIRGKGEKRVQNPGSWVYFLSKAGEMDRISVKEEGNKLGR